MIIDEYIFTKNVNGSVKNVIAEMHADIGFKTSSDGALFEDLCKRFKNLSEFAHNASEKEIGESVLSISGEDRQVFHSLFATVYSGRAPSL